MRLYKYSGTRSFSTFHLSHTQTHTLTSRLCVDRLFTLPYSASTGLTLKFGIQFVSQSFVIIIISSSSRPSHTHRQTTVNCLIIPSFLLLLVLFFNVRLMIARRQGFMQKFQFYNHGLLIMYSPEREGVVSLASVPVCVEPIGTWSWRRRRSTTCRWI